MPIWRPAVTRRADAARLEVEALSAPEPVEVTSMELDPVSRVLFPRPSASYNSDSFPGELIWVPRSLNPQTSSPEDCIPLCLLQCAGAQYMVVYLHSNFEDLGRCHNFCLSLRYHLKVHVLAVEYPGYGISPGKVCDELRATESALVAARFAHEVLRMEWSDIILLGRSIGTGPATSLAASQSCSPLTRVGGLVLVAPFLSIKELCWEYIGAAAGLVRERFANIDLMPTAADIWVVEEMITGAVEYSLDEPALEPDPEGVLRGAPAVTQVPWLERSRSPEIHDLMGLPPQLANDPIMSHRMAQLLQRAGEVADQALSRPDGASRRSLTRDSARSRASTSTPRGSLWESDIHVPNDEGVKPQRPRQGAKSNNRPVTRVSLVVV